MDLITWNKQKSQLVINNAFSDKVMVGLKFGVATGHPEEAYFSVRVGDMEHRYTINSTVQDLTVSLELSPGDNNILFETDAKRVDAPADPRELFFSLSNLSITLQ